MDSLHQVHLEWMYENQPHLVRQLDRAGKLLGHLEQELDRACQAKVRALAGGWAEDQAQEVLMNVLAPSDGPALEQDPPPEPVPYEEQLLIESRLDEEEAKRQP
jgi:hypothetical protein